MSRIEAIIASSQFVSDRHLIVFVDGRPFDELVAQSEASVAGLVPSLLGWFHNDEDGEVPWERILPPIGCTSSAPILICPDDLDYCCSVVMVEVVAGADDIRWERVGLDATKKGAVGSCVRWLSGIGRFCFSRHDYERCLDAFRSYYRQGRTSRST